MGKSEKYGQALEELESMHRAGRISDSRYELHKAKLLNEAAHPPMNPVWRFVSGIGIGLIVLLLLGAVLRVLGS